MIRIPIPFIAFRNTSASFCGSNFVPGWFLMVPRLAENWKAKTTVNERWFKSKKNYVTKNATKKWQFHCQWQVLYYCIHIPADFFLMLGEKQTEMNRMKMNEELMVLLLGDAVKQAWNQQHLEHLGVVPKNELFSSDALSTRFYSR